VLHSELGNSGFVVRNWLGIDFNSFFKHSPFMLSRTRVHSVRAEGLDTSISYYSISTAQYLSSQNKYLSY